MAKKSNKETNEKNQPQSFDQELNELREAMDSDIEEMGKMDFAEFRREILEHLRTMGEAVFILADELMKEKDRVDGCFDVIIKNNKDLRTKIDGMAQTLFVLSCKIKGPPITKKDREDIWGLMGYKWTPEDDLKLQAACLKMAMQAMERGIA